ncbi:MAG TPA: ABC transporter permease [Beijerinckiaceae bacterium]|nr:ABC transporter permease [Beijerinckiaceae bacterium]
MGGLDFLTFFGDALSQLSAGIPRTMALAGTSLVVGFVLAIGVAGGLLSREVVPRSIANGYVYIFRSSPLLVQIFLIYYGSGQFRGFFDAIGLWGLFREAWFCAILALALNTCAYQAVLIAGGLRAVPWGQIEAAQAVGMSRYRVFVTVAFPQALRHALPAYSNEVVLMIKATALASTITILEITGLAKQMASETYRPFEVFVAAGLIYISINGAIVTGFMQLERYLRQNATLRT